MLPARRLSLLCLCLLLLPTGAARAAAPPCDPPTEQAGPTPDQPPDQPRDQPQDQPAGWPALRFAEHLYAERDYYRAISEYKRFLFSNQNADLADWVRLRMGQAYLAGERPAAAQALFFELSTRSADARLRAWASVALARSHALDGRRVQAADLLQALLKRSPDPVIASSVRYLLGCVHIRTGELDLAERTLAAIPPDDPLSARAAVLLGRLPGGRDLPYKSPVAAGLLSLVPGLGHFYLEETSVGITAMAWNALFGYATYEAFRHRRWGLGALLATLELLWYSGTIYGAVAGAERYNRDAVLNFIDELDRLAGLDLPFPGDGWMASLLLEGHF